MAEYALPLGYALFLWWFTTGLIFVLNGLPRASYVWSMAGATLVLAAALAGLTLSAPRTGVGAAYLSFTCGLLIWGWQTMSYYMGFITGPRRRACPRHATGGRRFVYGLAASLYHELVVLVTAGGLITMTWGQPNQIGTWTFVVLWLMHVSAKLNLFLGVRNHNSEFLPAHLDYLASFFRRRPMNPLFPVSVALGTAATAVMVDTAIAGQASDFTTVGYTLLAALTGLAVLEHWFLVLPIPAAALWRWSLAVRRKHAAQEKTVATRQSEADNANPGRRNMTATGPRL